MYTRIGFVKGTLSADISAIDTTISSAEFATLPVITSAEPMLIVLDPAGAAEIIKITAHTGASTSATVVRGVDTTAYPHFATTVWTHGVTASDFSTITHLTYTAGDLNVTSTSWVNLNTATDLTLPVKEDDIIRVGMNGAWAWVTSSIVGRIDVVSVVGGNPVNSLLRNDVPSETWEGVNGWKTGGPYTTNTYQKVKGSILYKVKAADISNGAITVRFRVKVNTGSRYLLLNSNDRLQVWMQNLR